MREIKFAWVCRNIHFNKIERIELTDTMLLDGNRPAWITSDNCELIDKILPTGLKDKNGEEIWEADIIKQLSPNLHQDMSSKTIFEVIFQGGCFQGKQIGEDEWHWVDWPTEYFEGCEIIGNIYENPELLKEPE